MADADDSEAWEDDDALVAQVRAEFPNFSVRDARYLRFREVFDLPPRRDRQGGHNQMRQYPLGSGRVALAIERAKMDPDYSGKFYRAVLIAWGSPDRAAIADQALRGAFDEDARWDLERARSGTRSRTPGGLRARFPQVPRSERARIARTLDDLRLGEKPSPAAVDRAVAFLFTPEIVSKMIEHVPAMMPVLGIPDSADEKTLARIVPPGVLDLVNNATRAADVSEDDPVGAGMAQILRGWSTVFTKASHQMTAQTASRAELDAARDLIQASMPILERVIGERSRPLGIARMAPGWSSLFGPPPLSVST
jgi:hypothetical protein